mmetsp:Transcript_25000/g.43868  ORF Transcript_25000/g.43868 Transcript_25000/m.43868 type:complete len:420 (+) Transcript_25000:559-1818(+)
MVEASPEYLFTSSDELRDLVICSKSGYSLPFLSLLFEVDIDAVIVELAKEAGLSIRRVRKYFKLKENGDFLDRICRLYEEDRGVLLKIFAEATIPQSTEEIIMNLTSPAAEGEIPEELRRLEPEALEIAKQRLRKLGEGLLEPSDTIEKGEKLNGKATMHFSGKVSSVYSGDWADGRREGFGTLTWANGNIYEGFWENDMMHGHGKFTWGEGSVYSGRFIKGKKTGYGKELSSDGDSYEGEWHEDAMSGSGTYYWKRYGVYTGEMLSDLSHGLGTNSWPDGCTYTGEWAFDDLEGQGELKREWGVEASGLFRKGIPFGYCSLASEQAIKYEGFCINYTQTLFGTLVVPGNYSYTGSFRENEFNGYGVFVQDGVTYEGEFQDGKLHGKARVTQADGEVFEGNFTNGTKEGPGVENAGDQA